MDDLLRRGARALREEAGAGDVAGAPEAWRGMAGWSEIARGVRQAARRRRRLVAAALQLALALGGLGAWAAASGRLPALFAPRAPAPPTARRPDQARRAHRLAASPLAVNPPAAESPAPTEATPPLVPAPATPAAPLRPPAPPVHRLAARGPAPPAAPAATAPPPIDADAVYREAHEAHFVRRDYAAALAAWDRYIALGPQTFTPEARYNRAIALVRLQRREEAAAQLRPFAAGDYGGYRAEEARALLRLLGAPP
jgi:hypothetical protein